MNTVGIVAVRDYVATCATALELAELKKMIAVREAALLKKTEPKAWEGRKDPYYRGGAGVSGSSSGGTSKESMSFRGGSGINKF